MTLAADRVTRTADGRLVLDGVGISPPPGAMTGLLGPNGSGKSTLLRVLCGVLAPASGVVTLDGTPLGALRRRDIARRVAVVEQQADTLVELTVAEVVRLGRIPHRRAWAPPSAADERAVRDALDRTGLADRADRAWHTLSGGERQRVQIARALAQEPRELLLDEPTNHLDIQHQHDLLHLVGTRGRRMGAFRTDGRRAAGARLPDRCASPREPTPRQPPARLGLFAAGVIAVRG
ncbi:ABC transporter ATP-binding protein [Streptomyces sp. CC228A]|uniref:ABC transporter ATP-binding protein n=1 Tax=Streptomyces sp. CC228A TaxID=2898186 RepID=UPI001F256863|nr:ABC transporter ATP-binding protein [Streptomyces sp. CC228A]